MRKTVLAVALGVLVALPAPGLAAKKQNNNKKREPVVGSVSVPFTESAKLERDRALLTVTLRAECFVDESAAVDALNELKTAVLEELKALKDEGRGDEINAPGHTAQGGVTLSRTVLVEQRSESVDDDQCTNVGVASESVTVDTGATEEQIAEAIDKLRAKSAELQAELRENRKEGEERKRRLSLSYRPATFYASEALIKKTADELKKKIEQAKEERISEEVEIANGGRWWITSPGTWHIQAPQKPAAPGDFPQPKFARSAAAFESAGAATEIEVGSGTVVVSRTFSVSYHAKKVAP